MFLTNLYRFIYSILLVGVTSVFINLQAQTIAHKKVNWTVGADTLKGATLHTTILAGQSFIGRAQGATYTIQAGFFPVIFNEAPIDITPSGLTAPENNSLNDLVLRLTTIEPELVEVGDTHSYTLIAGSGDVDNPLFIISGDSLLANTYFDYETKSNYFVRIQTDDGDYGKFEKAFTIIIADNNDLPDSIIADNLSIGENAPLNTLIGSFKSRDQDTTSTHTYTLVVGNGDVDNSRFTILNDTSLITNTTYDFETSATHSIRLRTTDNKGGTYDSTLVIQVVDENDTPTDITYDITDILVGRPENESIGTTVLNLSTVDQDAADTYLYTLVTGTGDEDNAYFSVLGSAIVLADTLNFELQTTYNFRVQTDDQNGGLFQKSFGINVIDSNDAPYDIDLAAQEIVAGTLSGSLVGKLVAKDEDLDIEGNGDSHQYLILGGSSTFDIDNNKTDFLTVTREILASEIGDTLTFTIRAKDSLNAFFDKTFNIPVVSSENSTNVAPLLIQLSPNSFIDHNATNKGLLQLSSQDTPGDTHTYALVAGTGNTHNQYFTIVGVDSLAANQQFIVAGDSIFSVRVKSTDQDGLSLEQALTFTVTPYIDTAPPVIAAVMGEGEFINYNTPYSITATITDDTEVDPAAVNIYYKKIIDDSLNYTAQLVTDVAGDTYTFNMAPNTHGAMGLEYYVSAADTAGNTEVSGSQKAYVQFNADDFPIPAQYLGKGGKKSGWRIFSIPFDLDEKQFAVIFGGVHGEYDKTKWRLVRWKNEEYQDLPSIGYKTVLGEGYWFNAEIEKEVKLGKGKINSQIPFKLTLTPGFNQIGNPYNVPISWNKVLANNPSTNAVSSLYVFADGDTQRDGDIMPEFSGGFVYVDGTASVTLEIDPILSKSAGGRLQDNTPDANLSNNNWLIELIVADKEQATIVGGFGMHEEALTTKDVHDRLAVPRFQAYTEIYSKHEEYSYPWFRRDVVSSLNEYKWDFTYESNVLAGEVSFKWNPDAFGDGFETLNFYNKGNGDLIDMRAQSSYQFNSSKALKFSIFFSRDPAALFMPAQLLLGDAYPNPTNGNTIFPVVLPDNRDEYNLEINIYNLQGVLTKTIVKGKYKPGVHEFQYNFNDGSIGKGIYIYQLKFNDGSHSPIQKRIFIKN